VDWDEAYDNSVGLPPDVPDYYALWARDAAIFRKRMLAEGRAELGLSYGPDARQRLDLFRPKGSRRGLVVFVHGGYWQILDGTSWSHFAAGALAHDFAVAVPSYRLCPAVRITDIAVDVAAAVARAVEGVDGPIHLSGHSAGGQLVARLATATSPLPVPLQGRIRNVVPISGLHDLRPLMLTAMNRALHITEVEAARESPAVLMPLEGINATAWVGASERPELIRQTELLAGSWPGSTLYRAPGRHHFDVIDGLKDADDPLTLALVAG
jgi:arylformamidase